MECYKRLCTINVIYMHVGTHTGSTTLERSCWKNSRAVFISMHIKCIEDV